MAKILIKNGKVISPTGVHDNDVLIDGETVTALGAHGFFAGAEQGCDKVIDAAGKYVIPGGVDVHTHMELPFGGTFASDTFETGSRAAAWGGVTTIVDMAVQRYGENVFDGLAEWHRKAEGQCAIDYAFHQIIGGVDDQSLKAMKYLTEHEGISSFKLFMAYPGVFYSDDGQILRAMQTAAECGAMIMMHAENGIAIDVLVQQALARGESDPKYHSYTRPSP
ncbi:MAG: amidohydrolase family protein, partial [Ilumatobacteraceae bacterium]